MVTPGRHIQVKASRNKVIAVTVRRYGTHQVLQVDDMPLKLVERNREIALALVLRVVRDDNQRRLARGLPYKADEAVRCPVAIPGRRTLQQSPLTVASDRQMYAVEKAIIEIAHRCVDWFLRPAAQVHRELLPSAFE